MVFTALATREYLGHTSVLLKKLPVEARLPFNAAALQTVHFEYHPNKGSRFKDLNYLTFFRSTRPA
jgi:hypothetical protein